MRQSRSSGPVGGASGGRHVRGSFQSPAGEMSLPPRLLRGRSPLSWGHVPKPLPPRSSGPAGSATGPLRPHTSSRFAADQVFDFIGASQIAFHLEGRLARAAPAGAGVPDLHFVADRAIPLPLRLPPAVGNGLWIRRLRTAAPWLRDRLETGPDPPAPRRVLPKQLVLGGLGKAFRGIPVSKRCPHPMGESPLFWPPSVIGPPGWDWRFGIITRLTITRRLAASYSAAMSNPMPADGGDGLETYISGAEMPKSSGMSSCGLSSCGGLA
jgi:hypothetical protein